MTPFLQILAALLVVLVIAVFAVGLWQTLFSETSRQLLELERQLKSMTEEAAFWRGLVLKNSADRIKKMKETQSNA